MNSTRNQLLAILIVGIFAAAVPLAAQTNSQIADHVLPANPPTNAPQKVDLKFSFCPQQLPGYTRVTPETAYNVERGYGFDLGSKVSAIDYGGKKLGRPCSYNN